MIVARKPVGNYEGLYCKVASHPAPGEKRDLNVAKWLIVHPLLFDSILQINTSL